MNVKFRFPSFFLLPLLLLAACCNKPQSQSDAQDSPGYKSTEAPAGIGSGSKMTDPDPSRQIAKGACRIAAEVLSNEAKGYLVKVEEVKGYGPNFAAQFPLEGDTLRVAGTSDKEWPSGSKLTLEVRPVTEAFRDAEVKVVEYVKTVE